MSLDNFDLLKLPLSNSKLTSLRTLRLDICGGISELPSMREMWSLENLHICNCDALQELPARIDALAALHALELEYLETFQKPNTLSFSILKLTV